MGCGAISRWSRSASLRSRSSSRPQLALREGYLFADGHWSQCLGSEVLGEAHRVGEGYSTLVFEFG